MIHLFKHKRTRISRTLLGAVLSVGAMSSVSAVELRGPFTHVEYDRSPIISHMSPGPSYEVAQRTAKTLCYNQFGRNSVGMIGSGFQKNGSGGWFLYYWCRT